MKKQIALLFLLPLFFLSCGQKTNSNSGYYGSVKKVISYSCPVKQGKIPKDTADYSTRTTTTYDSLGNKLENNDFFKLSDYTTEISTIYSGTGKNRTFKTKIISGQDNSIKESAYKYVWEDDYHFSMMTTDKNDSTDFVATTTLDRKFRVVEIIYKSKGKFAMKDEYEYIGKHEKALKRTIDEGEKDRIIYTVTVVKEFDKYGNPTVAYCYDDAEKEHLTAVFFYEYEYYKDGKPKKQPSKSSN